MLENGLLIERHDCGRSEQFIPDWIEMGVCAWNPAQITNDLVAVKKNYGDKIAICGGWDNLKYDNCTDEEELRAALKEYVDTFAPGGRFTFMAFGGGKPDDPVAKWRRDVIKDFYDNYAHDWYKTHN